MLCNQSPPATFAYLRAQIGTFFQMGTTLLDDQLNCVKCEPGFSKKPNNFGICFGGLIYFPRTSEMDNQFQADPLFTWPVCQAGLQDFTISALVRARMHSMGKQGRLSALKMSGIHALLFLGTGKGSVHDNDPGKVNPAGHSAELKQHGLKTFSVCGPLQIQAMESFCTHLSPVNPGTQSHVYMSTPSTHFPSF